MDKLIKVIVKHKYLVILLLIFVIPLTIHLLFKIKAPIDFLVAEWNVGDILIYYASILTCIATSFLAYVAIEQNKRVLNLEENNKKSYIALDLEKCIVEYDEPKITLELRFKNVSNIPITDIHTCFDDTLIPRSIFYKDNLDRINKISKYSNNIEPLFPSKREESFFKLTSTYVDKKFNVMTFGVEILNLYGIKTTQIVNVVVTRKEVIDSFTIEKMK